MSAAARPGPRRRRLACRPGGPGTLTRTSPANNAVDGEAFGRPVFGLGIRGLARTNLPKHRQKEKKLKKKSSLFCGELRGRREAAGQAFAQRIFRCALARPAALKRRHGRPSRCAFQRPIAKKFEAPARLKVDFVFDGVPLALNRALAENRRSARRPSNQAP